MDNGRIINQGTPEWFEIRYGRFTASEIWKLTVQPKTKKAQEAGEMSETAKGYILEKLQERLSGKSKPSASSAATEWGQLNEPLAIARYEELTGNKVDRVGFLTYGENAGCSTDGLVSFDGIVEVKCPYSGYLERVMENLADKREYWLQIQMGLMVTGRLWCDYIVFDPRMPEGMDISIQRVERDEEMIEEIKAQIEKAEKELNSMNKDFKYKISLTQKLVAA